jgi:hypothetical protein
VAHSPQQSTRAYAKLTRKSVIHKENNVLGKVLLWVSAIMFIAYGVMCLFSPALPTGYAGLSMNSGDALVEIGAMYGGLQTGFGIFCLMGALRNALYRPALLALVFLVGGLALARLFTLVTSGATVGSYTYGAMAYEFTTAILAGLALRTSSRSIAAM